MASRDSIALVIITYNEEKNIGPCLETAKWMDEIVIVDSFSTDGTLEICRRYTENLFQHPFEGYGKQKNYAIEKASGDWVFVLDADERIPSNLQCEIEDILQAKEKDCPVYRLARKNYFYGHWLQWGGQYPDWQIRLFRRGQGRNDNFEPHHGFVYEGKLGTLRSPLIHITERKISDHFPKLSRFTDLAAEQRAHTCRKVHLSDLFFRPLITFFQTYLRKKGYRDGIPGLIQAVFKSLYTFVKYAKVWEIHQRQEKELNAHRN